MQTGTNEPQTTGRKRRGERYYSPQLPVASSTDGSQEIPVPKAMQRAQTGAQRPITQSQPAVTPVRHRRQETAQQAVVRTPAASFDPERPRRQTGVQPAVAPAMQATSATPAAHITGMQPPVVPTPQVARTTGMQPPVQPMRQTGMQPPIVPTPQVARTTGKQAPVQPQMPPVQMGMPPMQQPMQGYGWQQNAMPQQSGQVRFGQGGQPPVPPPSGGYGRPNGPQGGHGRGNGGGSSRVLIIALVAIVAVALIVSAAIGIPAARRQQALVSAVNAYNTRYCDGVYVDGIALGGMTQEEAAAAVIAQATERTDSWSVRLTYQGQLVSEINAGMLGMNVDVEDALRDAWAMGHTGTPEERAAAMDALRQTPYEAWSAQPSSDTSVIDTLMENIRLQVYRVPQNAAIVTFNPDSSNPFTFTEEVQGRMLDVAPVKAQVYQMLGTMTSGDIELTPSYIQPEVTVADLQKTVVLRGSAYTEISTTSTEDRNNNIRRAFELCSGKIIAPGQTFSFNDTVGERSTENGFYHALEYVYDELTDGVGGGVCQASTTVMQAAIRAGLAITDHTPHSEKANYSEYGMDATVYWMYKRRIDMKFKNTTDSPIYIVCSVQSNPNNRKRLIAKCDIYGMDLGDVRYDMASELLEEIPFETIRKRDKDRKYVTYTDEEKTVTTGRIGYKYRTYRLKYVNGVEVDREFLFDSEYKKRDETIYYGSLERPLE